MNQSRPAFDRMVRALVKVARAAFPNYDFLARYPCTVTGQNADGTLELKPDVATLFPTFSSVPYKSGFPGVKLKIANGARCVVYYENGLRVAKVADVWENNGLVQLDITASQEISLTAPAVNLGNNPGAAAVGRVGDQVQVTLDPTSVATIIAPSGGGPCSGGGVQLTGTITAGSPKVKAS